MTEQEILNDFYKLGYKDVVGNIEYLYISTKKEDDVTFYYNARIISINKFSKSYYKYSVSSGGPLLLTMKEHKLLHELFECWGWL